MRSTKSVRRPHTTTTSVNTRKAHSKSFKAQRNQMKQWIASSVLSHAKPAPIVLSETVHTVVKVVESAPKKEKPQKKEAVKPVEKKTKSKPEKKPEPKVEKKLEPKVEKKPEPKVEKKPEPKVEKKPEPKVEKKPEPKVEKKPEPKEEKKPEPKAEKKPEPKVEKKSESKSQKKAEPKVEKKSEPVVEKEIEEKIEIKTQASLESQNNAKLDEIITNANNQNQKSEPEKKEKSQKKNNKAEQNGSLPKANGVTPKQAESPVQVCEVTSSVSDKENLSDSDSSEKVENRQQVKADKKLLENVQKLATQVAAKMENQLDPQTTPTMRERIHKLLPQDILFCSRLIDKHGDNFEAMVKDPNNTYRETARSLQRKIRIFKESPHFQVYLESKNNSVPLEQLLAQQAV
ncbi:unnamed protein product [Auanema sp. JU1783]|nr:unnamed protein product [Auanema sp. JU1783]